MVNKASDKALADYFALGDAPNPPGLGPRRWTTPEHLFGQPGQGLAIRNTITRNPNTLIRQRSTKGRTIFEVYNGLDAAVTVTLVGGNINAPGAALTIGGGTSIPANSSQTITTDISSPWLGVTVVAAATPTSGTITITGSTELP